MSSTYSQYGGGGPSLGGGINTKGLHLQTTDNEEEDCPPEFTTLANEIEKSKWSHIDDLDEFFNRVYVYHQNHGMPSLVLMEFLNLFQILFLACFSIFMLECVDYATLFQNQKVISDKVNNTIVKKNKISDVVFPFDQCVQKISFKMWLVLAVVIVFWLFRVIKAIYSIARYAEIRSFYINALNIQTKDLPNITWHEVQEKLLQMQKKHHLCVHKTELTELDIYHRILRFKNYQVAMVNQGLLPPKLEMPIMGQWVFLTTGFKYNFEFLFFWGPFAPFRNCYQLRPEFKIYSKRGDLTSELSKWILIFGLLNLILAPAIFLWQLLQFLYNYTEVIKREPGTLGARKWSNYGKLYLRHFNELDHELDARLARAYKPAMLYLSSFVSKFLVVVAQFVNFSFGAVFAVLLILTIYDEDVLNVEHVLTILTITGAVAGIARTLMPDETTSVYFVDQMMYQILAQVHYLPDAWVAHANAFLVRDEFVKLFQYRFVYFIEELLSPLVTPFVLIFWLRPRSYKFVDFLRNFTVEVQGVGDVCSFAQMDTRRHGNPRWLSRTSAKKSNQARNGKTELSLLHFVHTNPQWRMPTEAQAFLDQLRDQAMHESQTAPSVNVDLVTSTAANPLVQSNINNCGGGGVSGVNQNSLNKSLYHLQSIVYPNTQSNMNMMKSNAYSSIPNQPFDQQQQSVIGGVGGGLPRGAVSRVEGPMFVNKQKTLLTIAQASTLQLSQSQALMPMATPAITTALENNLDMCFSALYMHELHRKYHHGDYIDLDNLKENDDDDETAAAGAPNGNENNTSDENDDDYNNNDDSEQAYHHPTRPLLTSHKKSGGKQHRPLVDHHEMSPDDDDEPEPYQKLIGGTTSSEVGSLPKNSLKVSYTKTDDNTIIKM